MQVTNNNNDEDMNFSYLYKEIIENINLEDKKKLNLSFTEKFKTPIYNTEMEAKEFLEDSFFNSSCNSISEIELITSTQGFSYEANFSVYYKESFAASKKEQLEFNKFYEESIQNIKNKFNSEISYVNNHSFFKKHMKFIIIFSLITFILNSTLSSFI